MLEEMQEPRMRTMGDYLDMARRQRWVILISLFVCWLLVWAVGWLLPSRYESQTVVQIQQQQVSPKLVEPNSLETAAAQLEQVQERVLNPISLQAIIDRDHLYSHHHGLLALFESSDPVQQMQKDIKITYNTTGQQGSPQATLTGFTIAYTATNPALAQAVDRELANLFVDQNNSAQAHFSNTTTEFLQTSLDEAQNRLNDQEAKMKEFKAQHMGELPDQVQSNLQVLSGLQQQLQATDNALSTAQGQRLYLESLVQQYQSAQSDMGGTESSVSPSSLDKQLKDLEMQLAQERSQYTDNYPDVIALKDQIAKTKELKKQSEADIAAQRKSDKGSDGSSVAPVDVQNGAPTPMMEVQSQLKSNQLQIQNLEKARKGILGQIAAYQVRLDAAPKVDQQLSEISRGYNEASSNYDTLRQKWQDSQLAQNFPQGQQGEYSPSPSTYPTSPSAPNHLMISLGGLLAGLAIGVALAALLEFTDIRIRKEADLEGVISARVLVGIPRMTTAAENRRTAMLRWVERGAVLAMLVIVVAGNIYSFYRG